MDVVFTRSTSLNYQIVEVAGVRSALFIRRMRKLPVERKGRAACLSEVRWCGVVDVYV